ncbi:MAG TPA: hypothetical protein VJB57_12145 [Dehalococcoidia bacterium]|nr:hypothetical protein [Dehalococcoidia bacterium]
MRHAAVCCLGCARQRTDYTSSSIRQIADVPARVRLIVEDRGRPFFRRPAIGDS